MANDTPDGNDLQLLPEAAVVLDADERIVRCNPLFRDLLRVGRETPVTGRRIEELLGLAETEGADANERLVAVRSQWAPLFAAETGAAIQLQPDHRAAFQARKQPLADGGTAIVFTDITELRAQQAALEAKLEALQTAHTEAQKHARETDGLAGQLRQEKERAELANRTKSRFLAYMSHELRTPLNAVIGFSQVLRDQIFGPIGEPRYVRYSQDIYDSGMHLLDLINDLLDMSKIEVGCYEIVRETLAVADLIETSVRMVLGHAQESRIRLTTEIEADLPPIEADSRALKQVMLNLLSNALKFTPENGKIEVGARRDGDSLVLFVEDSGIGMKPDEINRLMQPFERGDSMVTRTTRGMGLGLALCDSLVSLHGGRLDIASRPGKGTTVNVRLPASAA